MHGTENLISEFTVLLATLLVCLLASAYFRVPAIVFYIISGMFLGPNISGIVTDNDAVKLLGGFGALYIMFLAGLELDLHRFRATASRSLFFGILTSLIPFSIGFGACYISGAEIQTSILFAGVLITRTLVNYQVLSSLKLHRRESTVIAVGGAAIADTAALLLLAMVESMHQGHLDKGTAVISFLFYFVLYSAVMFFAVPRAGRYLFSNISASSASGFVLVIFLLAASSRGAHICGLDPILGAFYSGLVLNSLVPEHSTLMNRIQFFGNSFFIPFFLIYVGMMADVTRLFSSEIIWITAAVMIISSVGGKWIAAEITGLVFRYSRDDRILLFSSSIPHAASTLAMVLVGFRSGIFQAEIIDGAIILILVTCVSSSYLTSRAGRRLVMSKNSSEEEFSSSRKRILVSVANPDTADHLIEVASCFRDRNRVEPVNLLSVVPDLEENSKIAEVENMLCECISRASSPEMPFSPEIRVALNPAAGVLKAARELLATTVVMGISSGSSLKEMMFGTFYEKILSRFSGRVLVCRMYHSLQKTRRIVVFVPEMGEYESDFTENMSDVKNLARIYSAGLEIIFRGEKVSELEKKCRRIKPACDFKIYGWENIGEITKRRESHAFEELVVVFSSRNGGISWNTQEEKTVHRMIDRRFSGHDLIMIYPAKTEESDTDDIQISGLASLIPAEGVMLFEQETSGADLIRQLLEKLEEKTEIRNRIYDDLVKNSSPVYLIPDVLFLHAHSLKNTAAALLIARSDKKIRFSDEFSAKAAVILLAGETASPTAHLKNLSRLAERLKKPGVSEKLFSCDSPEKIRYLFTDSQVS